MKTDQIQALEKLETGIKGFDSIAEGGIPKNRTTLIAGTSGSAKTVFATQFLIEGIKRKQPGVFVTFEESPADIRQNMLSFGWDIEKYEQEGTWAFVDGSPILNLVETEVGVYDLSALLARINHAVKKVSATRLCIDSLGAIFSQFKDATRVRSELFRISQAIKTMGVTAVLTAERDQEYGSVARFGVEEFVADSVIILRNTLTQERRRRTMEILKFRGTSHRKGEFPFTLSTKHGILGITLTDIKLTQRSSGVRISTGITKLDEMCGGGYYNDSIVLVSGATGTGKTLLASQFIAGSTANNLKCLMFGFEESRDQLIRNATGWGIDYQDMEKKKLLKIICSYPESASLEDHLIRLLIEILSYKPQVVVVDSLTALARVSTSKAYSEFLISLTSHLKMSEIAGLLTAVTPSLTGGISVAEEHISTITDTIIMLRYVEMFGEMQRGITVLKMRGSEHDHHIRQYKIGQDGMIINGAFQNTTGLLSGNLQHYTSEAVERLQKGFETGE